MLYVAIFSILAHCQWGSQPDSHLPKMTDITMLVAVDLIETPPPWHVTICLKRSCLVHHTLPPQLFVKWAPLFWKTTANILHFTLHGTLNPPALCKAMSVHDLLSSRSKVYRNVSYLDVELPVHLTPGWQQIMNWHGFGQIRWIEGST